MSTAIGTNVLPVLIAGPEPFPGGAFGSAAFGPRASGFPGAGFVTTGCVVRAGVGSVLPIR